MTSENERQSIPHAEALAAYKRGWPYFGGIVACLFMGLSAPDGVLFFYKLLGLVNIPAAIPLGETGTLHIWGIIPLGLIIFCALRLRRHWRGLLGDRFARLHGFLRVLPALIGTALLFTTNLITPSLIDRAYFAVVGRRSGLHAVTIWPGSNGSGMSMEFDGGRLTYSIRAKFINHGSEAQTFNIKLVYEEWYPATAQREIFIPDESGGIKSFTLEPRQFRFIFEEFTPPYHDPTTAQIWGRTTRPFSITLVNEYDTHSPNFLVRPPVLP
jgi:hypothetical protein